MKKTILLVLMTAAILAGCNRHVVINNIEENPIVRYDGKELTMDQVERAIVLGGGERGWQMKQIREGLIRGTLNNRSHQAVVDIKYDTDSYSILYRDSANLMYQAPNQIHRNYNRWVEYLSQSIDNSVNRIAID